MEPQELPRTATERTGPGSLEAKTAAVYGVRSTELTLIGNAGRVILVRRDGSTTTFIGGAGFNTAIGTLAAGVRSKLISVIGTDLSKDERATIALATEPPFLRIAPGNTCRFRYSSHADLGLPGIASEYGTAEGLTDHALGFDYAKQWVHISCRDPLNSVRLLQHALSCGATQISIDFIHPSLIRQLRNVSGELRHVAFIFMNEVEHQATQPWLQSGLFDGICIVTRGAEGVVAIQDGCVVARATSKRAKVIDTTGAGDVFAGAFLGRAVAGDSLESALNAASSIAGKKVEHIGTISLLHEDVVRHER